MASADEVIAAIDEGKSHLEKATASFANAKTLAEELSSGLAALNAEGTAARANASADSISNTHTAIDGAATTADEARSHAESVKNGGLTTRGTPTAPTRPVASSPPRAGPAGDKNSPRRALIDTGKFRYLLGQVTSGRHNTDRSKGMQPQFARVGIYQNPDGRKHLKGHLDNVIQKDDNVMRTFEKKQGTFEIRDSLFAGPSGFLHFESTWEIMPSGERRLTTVIPKGGKW